VSVQATAARLSQKTVAAQDMIDRFARWQGREPVSVAADATYGNGEVVQWLTERDITPYMRTRDSVHRKNSPFYCPERFTYQPDSNSYRCPAGQQLNYVELPTMLAVTHVQLFKFPRLSLNPVRHRNSLLW
jgi:hypothetical protein